MSGNTLVSEETITRNYQLDVNDLYDTLAPRTIKALSTCPSASEIRVIKAAKSTGGEFVFDTQIARTQYLSNVFKYFYRIPFIVTPTTWPQTAATPPADKTIDGSNFLKEIFSDNDDIAYAQQGIVQGENTTTLFLNSQALNPVIENAALSNITSPYNPTAEVSELIQASQPDRFQSFARYDEGGDKAFKFLNEHCNVAQTTINPLNEQNVFSSRYQSGYSTRTPQWEFIDVVDAAKSPNGKKSIRVCCNFWSYAKFSIGGTPNNESSLTGVERFGLTNRLANDLGSRVFAIKKVGGVSRYASIVQDTTTTDYTDAWLALKLISPPSYILDEMIDKKTNLMKPYSISYPRIEIKPFGSKDVAPGAIAPFNQEGIRLSSVPRSIYIGLLKERIGTFEKISQTPVNFGLISNLTITFESLITTFPTQIALDYLTTSNGYDELDPLGKLVKGYPIKLSLGKDITLPKDLVVGASGSYNLSLSGNYYNQGDEPASYKLYVVVVNEDTLDYDGHSFKQTSGTFVDSALLSSAYFLRDLYSNQQKEFTVLGGGKFGDAVKWLGSNALKLAKSAWNNREKIASTVGDVASLVKTVRGGTLPQYNVSGGAERGTTTFGAGSVKKSVFK